MPRILLTGMSGTGKSTVLASLATRGYRTVELEDDWCVPQSDGTRLWDEAKVHALLEGAGSETLVVAGCEANMGRFLASFDRVVLLSAPVAVVSQRLETRTTNAFGRTPEERARVLRDIQGAEPQLRAIADVEIDTSGSLDETMRLVLQAIAEGR